MTPTKPGPWSVNPADIEPRFLDLWYGLIFCAPLWEGSGLRAFDYASRVASSSNSSGGAWEVFTHGIGWSTYTTDGRMTFPGVPIPRGDSELSLFVAARMRQDGGSGVRTGNAIVFGADAGGNDYSLSIGYAGVDDWSFSGALSGVETWPAAEDGDVHTVSVSRKVGGVTRFITDGAFHGEAAGAATLPDTNADNILLGGASQTDGLGTAVGTVVVYVWNRALSDENLFLLHADPFGPIRPALFIEAAAPPSSLPPQRLSIGVGT